MEFLIDKKLNGVGETYKPGKLVIYSMHARGCVCYKQIDGKEDNI